MTPMERWLSVLRGREPDRVPMDYWATDEVTDILKQHLGCQSLREMYERLHIDAVIGVEPEYVGPPIPEDADVFGCRYRNVEYGTGVYRECVYHPLAQYETLKEIERSYSWPEVDLYDYSGIPDQIEGWEGYPIRGGGSEPFLDYKNLRGQEQAFIDLFLHPDIVHYCLDMMFDFCHENTKRIYEQIPGEVVFHGGMDNQHTLPFGSEEAVRIEVRDNLEILGRGGGYILAPCHNIQPITPIGNILAMYDEGYKRGKSE